MLVDSNKIKLILFGKEKIGLLDILQIIEVIILTYLIINKTILINFINSELIEIQEYQKFYNNLNKEFICSNYCNNLNFSPLYYKKIKNN